MTKMTGNRRSLVPVPPTSVDMQTTLPPDIELHRIKLEGIYTSVEHHAKIMDGLVFGYVGADAVVSLIPVFGDIASGMTTFWLLAKAREARMGWSDRTIILGFGVADVLVGLAPGVGDVVDVFFRAHAWNAQRVQAHVAEQLRQIEMSRGGDPAHLEPLRDQLYRGGRTKVQTWVRLAVSLLVCAGMLAYCSHEADLRNERIVACERAGGWLCSFRI